MLQAVVLSLILFPGCVRKGAPSYSHFEEIPASGWDPLDVLVFEPAAFDTTAAPGTRYDITLVMRCSGRHKPSAMPVAVTLEDANGTLRTDTLTIDHSAPSEHMSKRSAYGVTELRIPLYSGIPLTEGLTLSLENFRKKESTKGVLNIGVIMTATP